MQAGIPVSAAVIESLQQYPKELITEISPRDPALEHESPRAEMSYLRHGCAALDAIRLALVVAQKDRVTSILDLPSGHGRVMRFLRAEYPDAQITACDLMRDGVDFCAKTFGAKPLYGREHPRELETEDRFDLVWCGSLLTHVDAPMWEEFLDFFESVLAPGGLLVFSTMGRSMLALLRDPAARRSLVPDGPAEAIVRAYDETDFGYADYLFDEEFRRSLSMPDSYGIAVAHPSWTCSLVARRPTIQLLSYMENRWSGQDVIACMAVDEVTIAGSPLRIPWLSLRQVRANWLSSSSGSVTGSRQAKFSQT